MGEKEKKKGLIRSLARGTFRAGKATAKTTAKVTVGTTKVVAKGGYITIKAGGKAVIFAARKAFPRHPDESIWQYRKRMGKLGFKVSIFTAKIYAYSQGSDTVGQLIGKIAIETATDAIGEIAINTIKDNYSDTTNNHQRTLVNTSNTHSTVRAIPPVPPGLNTKPPPPIPPGMKQRGPL